MTGKQLKEYMEWSANYFDTIQPGDTEYRYNAERKKSKYVTYDIFGGVNYKIDLRNPKGSKIVDLTLADGKPVTDDMKLKSRYELISFRSIKRQRWYLGRPTNSSTLGI